MARINKYSLLESTYMKILRMRRRRRAKRQATDIFYLDRNRDGEFHGLYEKLRKCPNLFYGYTRMLPSTFDYILNGIKPEIRYMETNFQKPISIEQRLIVTLRYLATGIQFRQLAYSFCISRSAIATIVLEICKAIWNMFWNTHMPEPSYEQFKTIADEFWKKWQFPNCIGCLDGKHIRIKRPPKSGSMYYNYKNFFSIGMLALTDANYKFIMVDIGSYGKDSDGGSFEHCALRRAIESKKNTLPEETTLPGSTITAPFVFLGDEAFPLTDYLMRPFPRKTLQESEENDGFNYRLCRARMVVECSFGIIVTKFRLLGKAIETKVENAVHIVKGICLLHNIIMDCEGLTDTELSTFRDIKIDGRAYNIRATKKNNAAPRSAIFTRRKFARFFTLRPVVKM